MGSERHDGVGQNTACPPGKELEAEEVMMPGKSKHIYLQIQFAARQGCKRFPPELGSIGPCRLSSAL